MFDPEWSRTSRLIDMYEGKARNHMIELKQLQRAAFERLASDNNSARQRIKNLEEQLLGGLQQMMSVRSGLRVDQHELFDEKIEPIRKKIQSMVHVNRQLPEPKVKSTNPFDEDLDESNPYEVESRRYVQEKNEKALAMKRAAEEAKMKAEATAQIEEDMQDLEKIFLELQKIVNEQSEVVDSIEEHVEQSQMHVEQGHKEVKKAVQSKTAKTPMVAAAVGGLALGGPAGLAAGSTLVGVAAGITGIFAGVFTGRYFKKAATDGADRMAVLLETTLGDLVVDLFVKERPKCCLNFIKLCKMKYYNLSQFHTIEQNYIAQTGDPTGTGRGGESVFSYMYGDQGRFFEREDLPKMKHTRMGLVSFVNNGDNMLGSQFFVTLGENLDYLDEQHTIFGQVTEGLDTLERLNEQLTDTDHKPFRDIRIAHTVVIDDPFDDDKRLEYPCRSPSPTWEMLVNTDKLALDEKEDEDEGKTAEERAEELKQREMAEHAQILEMVGDLRDADDVPPENVLFVCKLNPVTTDEDLEIIFSRFGKINNCEIIKDRRTGDSLQYAFIEFDNAKSCEQAFFKMDNVLIDDRRIHVDFSQSVSKQYTYKPKSKSNGVQKTDRSPPPRKREHTRDVKREKSRSPPRRRRSPSPKRSRKDDDRRRRDRSNERRRDRSNERRRDDRRDSRRDDRRRDRSSDGHRKRSKERRRH